MTAEGHELHELVDELPEDRVAAALADVRRRLQRDDDSAWAPGFLGIVDGADLPDNLATHRGDYLAASRFGRDSLRSWSTAAR